MFLSETVPWDDEQLPSRRPSIGKRILRTVVRFSFVFLIGAGTTLGWQSYHGEAKELVRTWVPWLSWVLARAPATADTSSELGQRLKPVAIDLALVRRSVEQLVADQKQLATKQEEIAHDVCDDTVGRVRLQTEHLFGASAWDTPDPAPQTRATSGAVPGCAVSVNRSGN